jgi:hypothetical protein
MFSSTRLQRDCSPIMATRVAPARTDSDNSSGSIALAVCNYWRTGQFPCFWTAHIRRVTPHFQQADDSRRIIFWFRREATL